MVLIITASIYLLQQASQLAERSFMGNVIQWADYVEALNAITKEQQAVSGMSVAEAASALKYTKTASGMYLKTVMTTAAESAVGTTATEVAAAATDAATTTAVNLTLVEGAGGAAEVAGIGSIAMPIAACIAGAAGGYLIGKELNKNEAYSDFFDHLIYPVCDFVTGQHLADELYDEENAPVVPLLYDVNGNTYLPSGLVSGVKNYLDSGLIPSAETGNLLSLAKTIIDRPHAVIIGLYPAGHSPDYPLFKLVTSDSPFMMTHDDNYYYIRDLAGTSVGSNWISNEDFTQWLSYNSWIYINLPDYSPNGIIYSTDNISDSGILMVPKNWDAEFLPSGITKYTPSTTLDNTPKTDPNGKTWTEMCTFTV
jgi:hypothetical protein